MLCDVVLPYLCNAPLIRNRKRSTLRSTTGRLQILPVVLSGSIKRKKTISRKVDIMWKRLYEHLIILPGSHPRLCVHAQSARPHVVLLASCGHATASFRLQLLRQRSDVVRLEAATAADVADAHVPRLPSEAVHIPSSADTWLQA